MSLWRCCAHYYPHTHTHTHTHRNQSVRAAFPKYYSNPLMLACMSCGIGGGGDKRVYVFCERVTTSLQNLLHPRVHLCVFYFITAAVCACNVCVSYVCVWHFFSICVLLSLAASCSRSVSSVHLSVCFPVQRESHWSEVSGRCSLMIVHHFHSLLGAKLFLLLLRWWLLSLIWGREKQSWGITHRKMCVRMLIACACVCACIEISKSVYYWAKFSSLRYWISTFRGLKCPSGAKRGGRFWKGDFPIRHSICYLTS